MNSQAQLHVVVLITEAVRGTVYSEIARLGGSVFSDVGHRLVLLANISQLQAQELSGCAGVRHVGPVAMNRQIRQLRVGLTPDGRPEHAYQIRENNIVCIDSPPRARSTRKPKGRLATKGTK